MSDGKLSDEDMADLGRALLLAIRNHVSPVWHPMDCPSEIVGDLCNTIVELGAEVLSLKTDAERYRNLRDEETWGEDTMEGGQSRWMVLGELSGNEFDCFVDALTPWFGPCDKPEASDGDGC